MVHSEEFHYKKDQEQYKDAVIIKCNEYLKEIQNNFDYINSDPNTTVQDKNYWIEFCFNILTLRNKNMSESVVEENAIEETIRKCLNSTKTEYKTNNFKTRCRSLTSKVDLFRAAKNSEYSSAKSSNKNVSVKSENGVCDGKSNCSQKNETETLNYDQNEIRASKKNCSPFVCDETDVFECINNDTDGEMNEENCEKCVTSEIVIPSSNELPTQEAVKLELIWESESVSPQKDENMETPESIENLNENRSIISNSDVFDEKALENLGCKMKEACYFETGFSAESLNSCIPFAGKCNRAFDILNQIRFSLDPSLRKEKKSQKLDRNRNRKSNNLISTNSSQWCFSNRKPKSCDTTKASPACLYCPSDRSIIKDDKIYKKPSSVLSESTVQTVRNQFKGFTNLNRNSSSPVLIYKKETNQEINDFGFNFRSIAGIPVLPLYKNFMNFSKFKSSYKMAEEYFENIGDDSISSINNHKSPSVQYFNDFEPEPHFTEPEPYFTEPESYYINAMKLDLNEHYSNSLRSRNFSFSTLATETPLENKRSFLIETNLIENIYQSVSFIFKTNNYQIQAVSESTEDGGSDKDLKENSLDFTTKCIRNEAEKFIDETESDGISSDLKDSSQMSLQEPKVIRIECSDEKHQTQKRTKSTVLETLSSPVVSLSPKLEKEISANDNSPIPHQEPTGINENVTSDKEHPTITNTKTTVVELSSSPVVALCPKHEADIEVIRKHHKDGEILISKKLITIPEDKNKKKIRTKESTNKLKTVKHQTNCCRQSHSFNKKLPSCPVHSKQHTDKRSDSQFNINDVNIKFHNGKFVIYEERKRQTKQKSLWNVITEHTMKLFNAVSLSSLLFKHF